MLKSSLSSWWYPVVGLTGLVVGSPGERWAAGGLLGYALVRRSVRSVVRAHELRAEAGLADLTGLTGLTPLTELSELRP